MKDQLRESFREGQVQKAPARFTEQIMHKIEQQKTKQKALVPKAFLWFFVTAFIATIVAVLFTADVQSSNSLAIDGLLADYYKLLPSLVLPLCIGTLLLIQQVFHYKKIA